MRRRDFFINGIRGLSGVLLVLGGSACKSSTTPSTPGTSKTFTSTDVQYHTHTVTIQRSEIDTPPSGGISRQTSTASSHSHTFTMSQDQLMSVQGGSSVQIETDVVSGHSHTFTISKWY